MKLSKNYVENVYLREELVPEKATVDRFNLSRALQNKYGGDSYGGNLAYKYYLKESTKLLITYQLERITFSELVDLLITLRLETVLKYPTLFRQDAIGWYDLQRMTEKDEKEVWKALPVDKTLLSRAKKEARISYIVRR